MTGDLTPIEMAQCEAAERALDGLSDKARVNFAVALMVKATDPQAVGAMRFAASQAGEMVTVLMREAFDAEALPCS